VIGGVFVTLARPSDCPYLSVAGAANGGNSSPKPVHWISRMAPPFSARQEVSAGTHPPRTVSATTIAAAGLGTALVIGALALWFHYGTAVFFEMIASGIAACF
jgi:hypothetical protein